MARPTSHLLKAMTWRKALTWLAIFLMVADTVSAGHLLGRLRSRCGPVRRVVSHVRCRAGGGLLARMHSHVMCGATCSSPAVASDGCDPCESSSSVPSSDSCDTVVSSGEVISECCVSEGTVINEGYVSSGEIISEGYVSSGEIISEGYVSSGEIISEGYVSSGEVISGEYVESPIVSEGYSGYSDYSVISGGEVISDGTVVNQGCATCNSGVVSEGVISEGVVTDGYVSEGVSYSGGDNYSSSGIGAPPLGPNETVIEEGTIVSVSESGSSAASANEPTPAAPMTAETDDNDLFATPEPEAATPPEDLSSPPGEPEATTPEPAGGADDLFGPAGGDAAPTEPAMPESTGGDDDLFGGSSAPAEPTTPAAAGGADDLFGPAGGGDAAPEEPAMPEPTTPEAPAEEGNADLDDLFGGVPAAPDLVSELVKETSVDLSDEVEAKEVPMILRTWSDDTGTYQTEARLQEINNTSVRLMKSNGKTCTVPFSRLSQTDLNYVQQQAAHFGVAPLRLIAAN